MEQFHRLSSSSAPARTSKSASWWSAPSDPYVLTPGFGQPEDFEPEALRERALETLVGVVSEVVGTESDVEVEEVVLEAAVLVEAAHDADLLVIGSRGHGGLVGTLLGSVSQHCVQHAPCPVLVVPAKNTE